jgi:hypothetical protein
LIPNPKSLLVFLETTSFVDKVIVEQMVWCGTDSVVLYWDKILLMVGPYGDWIKYTYEEPIYLIPECDGVRIISNQKCEFLQKVPGKDQAIKSSLNIIRRDRGNIQDWINSS